MLGDEIDGIPNGGLVRYHIYINMGALILCAAKTAQENGQSAFGRRSGSHWRGNDANQHQKRNTFPII